jgi:hypothetical protein
MKSDGVTGDWFSGGEKIYCPFNFLVHDYYYIIFACLILLSNEGIEA